MVMRFDCCSIKTLFRVLVLARFLLIDLRYTVDVEINVHIVLGDLYIVCLHFYVYFHIYVHSFGRCIHADLEVRQSKSTGAVQAVEVSIN